MPLESKKDVNTKKSNFKITYTIDSEGNKLKKEQFVGSFKGHVRKMRAIWNKN